MLSILFNTMSNIWCNLIKPLLTRRDDQSCCMMFNIKLHSTSIFINKVHIYKLHLFIKGIKRNALSNSISVKFLWWKNNTYTFMFGNVYWIHLMILKTIWIFLKEHNSILGVIRIRIFGGHLVDCLYLVRLKVVIQSVGHICRK
jgi:hypothetical protein